MFTDILWRFLILEMFVLGALCNDTWQSLHPQRQFCTSKYVLLVNIRKEISRPRERAFQMEIKRVFKGDARKLNLTPNRFVILEMPLTCRYIFSQSEDYVIFGENKNGNLYTSSCYGNMMWEKASQFYQDAFETYYKDNCDCYKEIPTRFNPARLCYWWYSYMERRDKSCSWAISSDLQTCEQQ